MAPPPRSGAKTPVAGGTIRRQPASASAAARGSPSKIPARAPLSNLTTGSNSPERRTLRADPRQEIPTIRGKMAPPTRAPPPKMRDLFVPPEAPTPVSHFRPESVASSGSVRHVSPEDVYDDRFANQPPPASYHGHHSLHRNEGFAQSAPYSSAPPTRHISNTSSATTNISGSENWETYSEISEPEPDASDAYYAKLRAARGKRFTPDDAYPRGNTIKKQKGIPPYGHAGHAYTDADGNRIVSGSEANWTDEDAF
jgi:protein regulator of cytokinesis 1